MTEEVQDPADNIGTVTDSVIQDQINFLYQMGELDFSELFDEWNDLKIKAVKNSMMIIHKRQTAIKGS